MTEGEKQRQLRKFKMLATGLFLLMVVMYIISTFLISRYPSHALGYIRAFAEAGMVGALADWFAVTALFHKPLGLPIPHTNLIENSKQRIGDNLGNFVAGNFLTAASIRPYIEKLRVSRFIADWLLKEKNVSGLVHEFRLMTVDLLHKTDDKIITGFIAEKITGAMAEVPAAKIVADGLVFMIEKGEHENFISTMSGKIKNYISQNTEMVRSRVHKESYFFIPKFVDNRLSEKITEGLFNYFEEIEKNPEHPLRAEIGNQLLVFAEDLRTNEATKERVQAMFSSILTPQSMERYIGHLWTYIKKTLSDELQNDESSLLHKVKTALQGYAARLHDDEQLQQKIDGWLRLNAYRLILKNKHGASELISRTVGNWEGRELSNKLELEVGKDLQYIRINGTLVGGLMGLLIYAFTHLFTK